MKPSRLWSVFGALVGNVLLLTLLVAVRSYCSWHWSWYIACAAFVLSLINTGRELIRSDGS